MNSEPKITDLNDKPIKLNAYYQPELKIMTTDSSIRVSVITPSYNQGKYLEQAIESVLSQIYSNVEYLIIDGNSSDNSVDIIKRYEGKLAYWISEPDQGQADAINKGFRHATGEFLCWLNSDDILYTDFISQRVKQFQENPDVDMIYGDVEQGPDPFHKRLRKGRQTNIRNMLKYTECPIPQQSVMWRRDAIEKIGYLEPQWHVLLDREYFIRTAANCSIKHISGAVSFFRNHEQSKSIAEKTKWAEELPVYYEAVFNSNKYHLSSELLSYKNKCLSSIYLKCAKIYAKAGKMDEAERFFDVSKKTSYYHYIINRYVKHLI